MQGEPMIKDEVQQVQAQQNTFADSQLLFQMVDSNSDGHLSTTEIDDHLSALGVPSATIKLLFDQLDTNKDGVVSKQELVAGYSKYRATVSKANKRNQAAIVDSQLLFNIADTNGDGTLTTEELSNHLADMGVPADEVERLLISLDTDCDGQVSRQEFLNGYNHYYETLHRAILPVQNSNPAVQNFECNAADDQWLLHDYDLGWDLEQPADQVPGSLSASNSQGVSQVSQETLLDAEWTFSGQNTSAEPSVGEDHELLLNDTQELLLSGAEEFVMLSFNAMAVVSAASNTILSSNPSFLQLVAALGGSNIKAGVAILLEEFLKDLSLEGNGEIHYTSKTLKADSATMTIKSAIKCTSVQHRTDGGGCCSSPCAQTNCSLLWVLASRPSTPEKIEISEPHFADPDLRVMADPMQNKRKRPRALKENEEASALEPQKMWQKYGEREVSSHGKYNQETILRAYFKCYSKDCAARLRVDQCSNTGAALNVQASGVHNHYVTLCST